MTASVYQNAKGQWVLVVSDHPHVTHHRLPTSPLGTEADALTDALALVRGETSAPTPLELIETMHARIKENAR